MNKSDNFEEMFLNGMSGIKRKRKRKRVSPFNPEDRIVSDSGGGKVYVPGQGIFEGDDENEIVLSCGHPASFGLGHIADCGHVICMMCIKKHNLECADPCCFRKLCTVKGCKNSAKLMLGVYFCRKHQIGMVIEALANIMTLGMPKYNKWADRIKAEYFSNGPPEEKKELINGRQNFPRKSDRAQRFSEENRFME